MSWWDSDGEDLPHSVSPLHREVGGQTLDLSASSLIHSGSHTYQEDRWGHLIWAQKKEGASDSQGHPGVVVSTLYTPRACKLRIESCRGNPTLVGLWLFRPFLLWGAMIREEGWLRSRSKNLSAFRAIV